MTESSACHRRFRRTVFVALLAAGLCVPLAATPESSSAALRSLTDAQRFFITRFQKHTLSRNLQDADRAFWVGTAFIRRLSYRDPSTVCCSSDRHYVTTVQSDYMSFDWTYEITFNMLARAPQEVLFIGFGEAIPDPLFFNEPRNSVYMAISQGTNWGSDIRLSAHDVGMWSHTFLGNVGEVGNHLTGGTFTARIRKIGARVTFEIVGVAGAEATIEDINAAAPYLANVPTRIFFGNALGNYTFMDMRLLPERPGYCR